MRVRKATGPTVRRGRRKRHRRGRRREPRKTGGSSSGGSCRSAAITARLLPRARLQTGRNGGEGSEIPAEREQLGAQGQQGQFLAEDLQAAVGAAIHHEDHFELAGKAGAELHQFGKQAVEVRLIPVNGDDEGIHLRWPALVGCLYQFQEFGVVPDIAGWVVSIGGEHQHHGVLAVFVLDGPNHGRQMEADGGAVEHELLAVGAIIGHHVTASMNADQKLVQRAMRVLAADLFAGDVVDQEVALDVEGDRVADFAEAQVAAEIVGVGQAMQRHAGHAGWGGADFGRERRKPRSRRPNPRHRSPRCGRDCQPQSPAAGRCW